MSAPYIVQFYFKNSDDIVATDDATRMKLMELAFRAAWFGMMEKPSAILIRSIEHNTTMGSDGKKVEDRTHITASYKWDAAHVQLNTHVTLHAYTPGPPDYTFDEATTQLKDGKLNVQNDGDRKEKRKQVNWPEEDSLLYGVAIDVTQHQWTKCAGCHCFRVKYN